MQFCRVLPNESAFMALSRFLLNSVLRVLGLKINFSFICFLVNEFIFIRVNLTLNSFSRYLIFSLFILAEAKKLILRYSFSGLLINWKLIFLAALPYTYRYMLPLSKQTKILCGKFKQIYFVCQ